MSRITVCTCSKNGNVCRLRVPTAYTFMKCRKKCAEVPSKIAQKVVYLLLFHDVKVVRKPGIMDSCKRNVDCGFPFS